MTSGRQPHLGDQPEEMTALTTQAAARMLGVSVGTVLNMVDRGQLLAWRTAGGHRRVVRESVLMYLGANRFAMNHPGGDRLKVMIVEDDNFARTLYQEQFAAWHLPVDVRICSGGLDAMLQIGHLPPDLLFCDLHMPEVDGFAIIRLLRADARYAAMDIVVITGMTAAEIESAGGLPAGVPIWHKPVPFAQMRGYLDARLVAQSRLTHP